MSASRGDRRSHGPTEAADPNPRPATGRPLGVPRSMPMLKSQKPWDREAALVALLLCGEFPELDAQYAVRHGARGPHELALHVKALLLVAHARTPGPGGDTALLERCFRLLEAGLPRTAIRRALAFSTLVLPALGTADLPTAQTAAEEADRVVCDRLMPENVEESDGSSAASTAAPGGARGRHDRAPLALRRRAAGRPGFRMSA